jgi:hypothetical protein
MRSKTFLCQSLVMKDLDEANIILNIKLIKGENIITLTQEIFLSYFDYKERIWLCTPEIWVYDTQIRHINLMLDWMGSIQIVLPFPTVVP